MAWCIKCDDRSCKDSNRALVPVVSQIESLQPGSGAHPEADFTTLSSHRLDFVLATGWILCSRN